MQIINKIKAKIHHRLFIYYFKKGFMRRLKELEKEYKLPEVDIPKLLIEIDGIISTIKEEVDLYSKVLNLVEDKYGKHNEAAELATIFPFLNLSMLDIMILHKQYLSTTNKIEKNFICRTAAHHMYEFLEDAAGVLGKQMNFTVDRLNNTFIDAEVKSLRKSFNELKAELHTPLKKLRHNVSGHKDRDIRNQIEISNAINLVEFQKNFVLFMLFFARFTLFKNSITDETLKRRQVINDVIIN